MADIWMDVDAALAEVPVNIMPLLDDTDAKTIEDAVAYNATGMDLRWNFVTTAGAYTSTAVTPTTGGDYDWAHQGDGMYSIEIPASSGASINNDTEGFGWFTGKATGVLPWRGPIIGFRASGLNNKLVDDAYSTTRGLAGTALPDAAADAAGGLIISDEGGLDADDLKADVTAILADTGTDGVIVGALNASAVTDTEDAVWDALRSAHTDAGSFGDVETTADIAAAVRDVSNASPASGSLGEGVKNILADTGTDGVVLATDAITSSKIADDAFAAEHFDDSILARLGVVAYGTAQSATSTTLVLAAASAFADDELNGAIVVITGGTGVGQSRVITNYTGSTDTAEVDAWTTTPSGTITYVVFAAAPASATSLPAVNVTQIAGSAVATGTAQLGVNVVSVTNDAITAAALAADVTTELQSGLATAATVNSLTAYVSPGISSIYEGMATAAALTVVDDFLDTEVSSILGNVVAIQANVNSVTAHVSPAVSSIYQGMATAAALTVVDDFLDTEVSSLLGYGAAIQASVSSVTAHVSPGISSIYGGMATAAALATVDDFLDTEVSSLLGYASAITAQTALLPSSPAAAGDAMTLTDAAVDAVLDEPVEGAYTLRQAMRLVLAVNAGKVSGAGTSSITIRDINDTADRITAEVDASGNRATVTKNVS